MSHLSIGEGLGYITNNKFHIDFRAISDVWCKIHLYFYRTAQVFSYYIVLIMSGERCVALYWPLKSRRFIVENNAKKVTLGVAIGSMLIMGNYLVHARRVTNLQEMSGYVCAPVENSFNIIWKTLYVITDLILATLVPTVGTTILTIILIWKLHKISSERAAIHRGQSLSERNPVSLEASVTILCISLLELMVYAPFIVLTQVHHFALEIGLGETEFFALIYGTAVILLLINIANYFWNFYIYLLRISSFRNEIIAVFKSCLHSESGRNQP